MQIGDILNKVNPVKTKREMSHSEYLKLVDRNTELIDELNDLKERIIKAREYIEKCSIFTDEIDVKTQYNLHIKKLSEILRGVYNEN